MKEIFSAFGSEVFRPLATVVIPGSMAISVWFIVLLQRIGSLRDMAYANHTETSLLLALASIASGLLVEDFGSRVEKRLFDEWLKANSKYQRHEQEWHQYLRLVFEIEPVGQRYLRAIVLRLKFELGTSVALVSSGIGLFWTSLPCSKATIWFLVCVGLGGYLLFVEARSSHRLLSEIRREILKGAIIYPGKAAPGPEVGG